MNCQIFFSLIDDFVDSTLAPADRAKMEEHLRMCSNCRKELEDLQSLLARSAGLGEMPQRDLWPQIETGINAAGVPQIAPTKQAPASAFSMRAFRLTWRLASVAILGTIILLAATYFRNRYSVPVSKTATGLTNVSGANGNPKPSGTQDKQGLRQDLDSRPSESNDSQPGVPAGNYAEACQCVPSAKIMDQIDRASIIDESLPGMRAREAASERLYILAGENSDDFFLHKASLENRYPIPSARGFFHCNSAISLEIGSTPQRSGLDLSLRFQPLWKRHPGDDPSYAAAGGRSSGISLAKLKPGKSLWTFQLQG